MVAHVSMISIPTLRDIASMYHTRSHRERDIVDDGVAQHGPVRKLLEFEKIEIFRLVFVHTVEDCFYILGPGAARRIQSPSE